MSRWKFWENWYNALKAQKSTHVLIEQPDGSLVCPKCKVRYLMVNEVAT